MARHAFVTYSSAATASEADTRTNPGGDMIRTIGGAVLAAALAGTALGSVPAAAQGGGFSGNAVRIGILND